MNKELNKSIIYLSLIFCIFGSIHADSSCSSDDCASNDNFCEIDNIEITDTFNDNKNETDDCPVSVITPVRTAFTYRSQGANTAREMVGWQWEINKPFMCQNYSSYYFAYEFQKTFKNQRLAHSLFGDDTLTFTGSLSADRRSHQLLADNFGLAQNFSGKIKFCPSIKNNIIDFGLFYGLDCFLQGSYFRIHAPFVQTTWHLDAQEQITNSGDTIFPVCYVSNKPNTRTAQSIKQALSGNFTFGDLKSPWRAGRFNFDKQKKHGLADIDFILGYNFINNDCYHTGLYIQSVIPTGPKPKGVFIFEPLIGNGGHFELGLGFSAHAVMWSWENQNIALFFEGNLTHMFNNTQNRLFDFQSNGAFSRYLLLKEYSTNNNSTYINNLISATNFNFLPVDVKINVKADASLMIAYRYCNLGLDFGYNFYGQDDESIKLKDCQNIDKRNFAIKGTEYVCCFNHQIARVDDNSIAQPAGAIRTPLQEDPENCPGFPEIGESFKVTEKVNNNSQPRATAFSAQPTKTNAGTCNVCLNKQLSQPTSISDLSTENILIIASDKKPTVFVSHDNLNLSSASAESILTHKFFGHLFYTWYDSCGRNPHIGVGGEVEFEGGQRNDVICKKTGTNQWGVWVKGGFSY